MNSVILYCPHLDRDIRGILARVPNSRILTGYPTPYGHDGCLEMHKDAVRIAVENGWESVFVMEDDCEFTPRFEWGAWKLDARWSNENGYDVLVGGCTRTYDERKVREHMIEVSAFHSAHCIVYHRRGFEKVLQHAVQPYDLSLGRECGCRVALAHPFVAVQRPSFSGILQQNVNYVPYYESHERNLTEALSL